MSSILSRSRRNALALGGLTLAGGFVPSILAFAQTQYVSVKVNKTIATFDWQVIPDPLSLGAKTLTAPDSGIVVVAHGSALFDFDPFQIGPAHLIAQPHSIVTVRPAGSPPAFPQQGASGGEIITTCHLKGKLSSATGLIETFNATLGLEVQRQTTSGIVTEQLPLIYFTTNGELKVVDGSALKTIGSYSNLRTPILHRRIRLRLTDDDLDGDFDVRVTLLSLIAIPLLPNGAADPIHHELVASARDLEIPGEVLAVNGLRLETLDGHALALDEVSEEYASFVPNDDSKLNAPPPPGGKTFGLGP